VAVAHSGVTRRVATKGLAQQAGCTVAQTPDLPFSGALLAAGAAKEQWMQALQWATSAGGGSAAAVHKSYAALCGSVHAALGSRLPPSPQPAGLAAFDPLRLSRRAMHVTPRATLSPLAGRSFSSRRGSALPQQVRAPQALPCAEDSPCFCHGRSCSAAPSHATHSLLPAGVGSPAGHPDPDPSRHAPHPQRRCRGCRQQPAAAPAACSIAGLRAAGGCSGARGRGGLRRAGKALATALLLPLSSSALLLPCASLLTWAASLPV